MERCESTSYMETYKIACVHIMSNSLSIYKASINFSLEAQLDLKKTELRKKKEKWVRPFFMVSLKATSCLHFFQDIMSIGWCSLYSYPYEVINMKLTRTKGKEEKLTVKLFHERTYSFLHHQLCSSDCTCTVESINHSRENLDIFLLT